MLEGLLGRGFASKCKSLIKTTKNRIDVSRRKKNATLKFLKKDMADLLANGLDSNAYGRAEGLLEELRRIWCYDFIEQCCDFVVKHLPIMQKIRHCPEDCREAVSSLMSAAARFSELPELRDLRDVFYERYGDSVELFANQEFMEKSSSKSSTKEHKIQLMQDIASEFSLKWDSRACEQRMSKTAASAQDQPKTYGSSQVNADKYHSASGKETVLKGDDHDLSSGKRLGNNLNEYKFINGKESNVPIRNEVLSNGCKPLSIKDESILKRDILFQGTQKANLEKYESWKEDTPLKTVRLGSSSQRKIAEIGGVGSKQQDSRGNAVPMRDGWDTSSHGKQDVSPNHAVLAGNNYVSQNKNADSTRDVQEQVIRKPKPYYNNAIPPPYTKSDAKPKDRKHGSSLGSFQTGSDGNVAQKAPSFDYRAKAVYGSERVQEETHHLDHERQSVGSARENSCHEGHNNYQRDGVDNLLPKPKSMRRRHSKSHSTHDDAGTLEDAGVVKRRSRSRRRNESKKGLQILVDDDHYQNEEERMIDRLLLHYSKKPPAHDHGKVRRKSRSHHAHHPGSEADNPPQPGSRDGSDGTSEPVNPPRSISLPREQRTATEATKTFTRAASFQPDRSSPARHVHPKLPDYDDLAARFAALKGR